MHTERETARGRRGHPGVHGGRGGGLRGLLMRVLHGAARAAIENGDEWHDVVFWVAQLSSR